MRPVLRERNLKFDYTKPCDWQHFRLLIGIDCILKNLMIQVQVKFTGAVESVTSIKILSLSMPESSTYRDIVCEIGRRYPVLIGWLIDQDGCTLLSSNLFLVNGEQFIFPGMENEKPKDGDELMLVSPITGG